jgi:hypothetical protein
VTQETEEEMTKDFAKDNASLYGILPQRPNETGAEFRERVARELASQGKNVEAHETLYNQKQSGNPFAYGALDDGYGDEHITQIAQIAEAQYQAQIHQRMSIISKIGSAIRRINEQQI